MFTFLTTDHTCQRLFSALAFVLMAPLSQAQVIEERLVIPLTEQGRWPASIPRPQTGQSSADVERHLGPPQNISAPVGQPPIIRWQYPGFTVYFEYDHVIHTVVNPPPRHQDSTSGEDTVE